jgi:hypothetical protein
VQDPVGHVRDIYQRLDLGDFEPLQPRLEAFVAGQKDYQTNVHSLPPAVRDEIRRRWSGYFEKYGYS